jgi:hypothetical protein
MQREKTRGQLIGQLPLFPGITPGEIQQVIDVVRRVAQGNEA